MQTFLRAARQFIRWLDLPLVAAGLVCSCYGILLVMTATASGVRFSRSFKVQCVALLIGFAAMLIIASFDIELLTDLWPLLFAAAAAAILLTILFGHGPTGSSNRNWLSLGPVDVQPSEFVKLAYVLILAKLLSRVKDHIDQLSSLLYVCLPCGLLLALMTKQGDTGTMLVFLFITAVMLFCAGLNWRYFAAAAGGAVVLAPVAWSYLLPPYMKNRILFGFRPELDPAGVGFQALQSKLAIGSGQLTGKGFGNATQISFLPAKETDFIFATAGEQFGFLGCLLIVVLLSFLMLRMLSLARLSGDSQCTLICVGIFALFFAQTFENIGMCIAILPVVGITLPFFSYGGSSMISCWCALGLVLAVNRKRINTLSFDPM